MAVTTDWPQVVAMVGIALTSASVGFFKGEVSQEGRISTIETKVDELIYGQRRIEEALLNQYGNKNE